jgi:3-oxoacyl-(acyl-carrier-protein) synthase
MATGKRVVITGLGFITSIGNNRAQVLESLLNQRSGIEIHPELDRPEIPVKLAGTIKGFSFPSMRYESWKLPKGLSIPRAQLRSMSPHVVYAYAAMQEAIADAAISPEIISNART